MPTDIIKKVQIKNTQSGLNDNYNVGAEAGDVEVDQTGNHITEDNVQDALSDIYDKFYNIDTTPTLNSDELVTSGGVALAIKNAQSVKVGSSSTAAATAAKVVTTLAGDFELRNGADLIVTFSYDNTAENITLNVDSTGAKSVYYKGAAIEASVIKTNIPYEFVYDGTNFVLVGSADGLTGVELTEEEYDDLPLTDRTNPDKLFFIEDGLEDQYSATMIAYDNGETGLQAVNVQDALDEIKNYGCGWYLKLRDIGTSYTAEMKEDISSGAFKKVRVGDYLTINNHVYYFAHPDYWLHTGDTECTTHHMLVVPAGNLVSGKMNNSHVTTGAYIGSDFKTGNNSNTALADIKAIIKADFGTENILTHREYFANAVTNGRQSAGAWYDSDIDLMNEEMVYGCPIFTPTGNGTMVPANYTIGKSQLKLFQERPDLIVVGTGNSRERWWLRDVVSGTVFANVYSYGNAANGNAGNSYGIRPAFAIC